MSLWRGLADWYDIEMLMYHYEGLKQIDMISDVDMSLWGAKQIDMISDMLIYDNEGLIRLMWYLRWYVIMRG